MKLAFVRVGVAGLDAGVAAFGRLGFDLRREGDRALAATQEDCLELRAAAREGIECIGLEGAPAQAGAEYLEFTSRREPLAAATHPNGVQRIERVYIAVPDVAAAAAVYGRALGLPVPALEQGTVINARMAAFKVGHAGLTFAQPSGPGVTADALARRGPGPFQILYRTSSMDAAARWIADQGLPAPQRGVRNTGEQAMLVPPDLACGVYVGFVGMP